MDAAALRISGSLDDPSSRIPDGRGKTNGRTWSSLPVLLIVMIMDKLDIFGKIRLAVVCRGWWLASLSYPKKLHSIGDGLPWITQSKEDFWGGPREFVSVVRRKRFSMDLPEFREAIVVSSKQGWILLRRENFSESKDRLPDSLFLLNPFTRCRINMPDVAHFPGILMPIMPYPSVTPCPDYLGSFSTIDGCPNRVVVIDSNLNHLVTIRVAYPGDEAWTEHSFVGQRMGLHGLLGFFVVKDVVYCVGLSTMVTYNLSTSTWKEIVGPDDTLAYNFLVEHEGKIMRLVPDDYNFSSVRFYAYNDSYASWEILNTEDLKNTSWFVSMFSATSFYVKDKGLKVYHLRPRMYDYDKTQICFAYVVIHDLIEGSAKSLEHSYPIRPQAVWVDIG